MENNVLIAVLLGLTAMLANGEYWLGSSMLSRPLVTCTITGLIMGDMVTGIKIGAMLELAFVGSFSIGGAIPPEIISGSILGTAFAIGTGQDTAVALTLGLPIASLVLIAKNVGFLSILPYFVHKADTYAENADVKGIGRMNFLGGFFAVNLPIGLIVCISYLLGSPFIQTLIDNIPQFIIDGLGIATGLLPAYGFALLLNMMVNKRNVVFFILGFALAVYLKVPVTGVAIFAAILALILTGYANLKEENTSEAVAASSTVGVGEGEIDYEDEEF
ncbi:PTS mannose/fructose/sorbose/N-acetylgalactosamine transporter subunit IIC [Aerococcus sanguinicola]|uniref:PTS mannose/fructose/sorbose/N-acetylgalactosamine transporter subunit IIC n=1 Tax=unclassified Aerococcus TaxID=2618060 RepID=UPI0008A1FED3|nr:MULTISPECIES: PTS sugar transporter subunit IIC [unclassified Aerococcus]KAB0647359.1 PTS sugar transporter subunit IIC [Aerococcus sanguinicola]MDK6233177.1 PTS sugar transporter subunit IIC [Aerococcus sp. UMB10185]MDK6856014.1 PTS sugar transporter subunit IIC [Aerococcus sp. UMB7533]MDK8502391.1 PTS sugar transporter subunit IIC [Aerococcus sp. UMB1112A]OFN00306.1 PTS sugar transporter [Aerococcus sp. HMSC062A02]